MEPKMLTTTGLKANQDGIMKGSIWQDGWKHQNKLEKQVIHVTNRSE